MWNLLWPMLMVVGANTVYNICAKSTPEKLNSFAALTINYGVAAALSLLLFFVTTGGEKNLIQEIGKTNWAPVVMGLSGAGLYPDLPGGMEGQCGLPGGQPCPGVYPGPGRGTLV